MYDCLWPQFDAGYPLSGMIGASDLRPCLAMTSGKYYLFASGWPYNPSEKDVTYNLFHHHGDAFSTLYSQIPQDLTVVHASQMAAGLTHFAVSANTGSIIALTVNGQIIGVAQGTGHPINITIPAQSAGAMVLVTVTKANYRRYSGQVSVVGTGITELKSLLVGASADYTAIGAYHDTITCFHDYGGTTLYCRYYVSYNGGSSWLYGAVDDTSIISESPDVCARGGGGVGVVYRYYTPTRQLRFTWRDYAGAWSARDTVADYPPYWNKPAIEYIGEGVYGVVYTTWSTPEIRAAYFDRSNFAPDCEYLLGDINGDGTVLGGDVTYGVRYFKGTGLPPPDSCYMDSTHAYIYVAGDVNGNCEFRGSDITRLVSYFKGLASLVNCHFFPPPLLRQLPIKGLDAIKATKEQ